METLFGLPAHPLMVHAPIVLLPLAALGAIIMGFSARFSVRFGPLVTAVAGVGAVTAALAKLSGQQLAESVGVSEDHHQAGGQLPFAAAGFFILVLALWLLDRRGPRNLGIQILAVVVIAASIIIVGWVIRTGHTGAEMVWQGIGQQLTGS
jgi:uncharacterized membrane protein